MTTILGRAGVSTAEEELVLVRTPQTARAAARQACPRPNQPNTDASERFMETISYEFAHQLTRHRAVNPHNPHPPSDRHSPFFLISAPRRPARGYEWPRCKLFGPARFAVRCPVAD